MAQEVYRELLINADNASAICTANALELSESGKAFRKYFDGGTTGSAALKDEGKSQLFPTAAAIAHKVKSVMNGGYETMAGGSMTVSLKIGDIVRHSGSFSRGESEKALDNIPADNVAFSNAFEWDFNVRYNSQAYHITSCIIGLYFYQYSCAANAAGNGIANTSVSNAAPYQGESVTFTAALKSGATWHGWYSDAACTQLVSTSQTYTTAASDLTLYAKATREITGTGAYARAGGQWAEAQDVYKKINGEWVLQTDNSYKTEMQNGNYKFEEVSA